MKKTLAIFTCLSLLLFLLLGSIYFVSMDRGFYRDQYAKNNTAVYTGISSEELDIITDNLLSYLQGKRENLDMVATIQGTQREVFDGREKAHMVDVQVLFFVLIGAVLVFGGLMIIGFGVGFYFHKRTFFPLLAKAFLWTCGISLLLLGLIAFLIVFQFEWFWTQFHLLVFTNDLWLLDPEISVMINLFPLEFFYACCTRILLFFGLGIALCTGLSIFQLAKCKKNTE